MWVVKPGMLNILTATLKGILAPLHIYASHIGSKTSGRFFSMFIISVLKHGAQPWLSLLHIHSTICSPDISAVSRPVFKYRLNEEMDTTMSLWISNNTCLAIDAMLPVLQSGELCAALLMLMLMCS